MAQSEDCQSPTTARGGLGPVATQVLTVAQPHPEGFGIYPAFPGAHRAVEGTTGKASQKSYCQGLTQYHL